MRALAVVGAGAAGLSAALRLQENFQVTLFEKDSRLGGHAHTVEAEDALLGKVGLDLGFMVMNGLNYPTMVRFLEELGGVELGESEMSFSYQSRVNDDAFVLNIERPGSALSGTLLSIVGEILRFSQRALCEMESGQIGDESLGEYLKRGGYSQRFIDLYVLAMGAALWSAPPKTVLEFPAGSYLSFFKNHGLIPAKEPLRWQHLRGGSRHYVAAFERHFKGSIRLGVDICDVRRAGGKVEIRTADEVQSFDEVVFACHADEALALLKDADAEERAFLSSFRYQENHAILHTDESVMPIRPEHWGSWNVEREPGDGPDSSQCTITYHLNRLQGLRDAQTNWFVTLNRRTPIRPDRILFERPFTHPIFDLAAIRAQRGWEKVSGKNKAHFCGAHFGYGFHEDAIRSGFRVARALGVGE